MTATPISTVDAFLKSVRNRLWIQEIIRLGLYGAWWTSMIALTTGFVHVFLYPLTLPLFAIVTLSPLITSLIWGLVFRKPSLQSAATAADKWFNAKSLMSTTLDQAHHANENTSRATKFVIAQAVENAPKWRKQLRYCHKLIIPGQLLIPVGISLAGCFLILLPQQQTQEPPTKYISNTHNKSPIIKNENSTDLVTDLQQALHTPAREKDIQRSGDTSNLHSRNSQTGQNNLQTMKQKQDLATDNKTRLIGSPNILAKQQESDNPSNMQTPGSSQIASPPQSSKSRSSTSGTSNSSKTNDIKSHKARKLDIEFFSITSHLNENGTPTAGSGENLELKTIESTKSPDQMISSGNLAASKNFSIPYGMTLSHAQLRFISLYFKSLGETP